MTATGERLDNLPPQQVPSDPNFDQTSYVRNLKRQMYEDRISAKNSTAEDDLLQKAESVEVKPMKFDGKEIRGTRVNVVTAPKNESNKAIVPILIIIILVLALGVIAYFMLFGNNPLGSGESSDSSSVSSESSEVSTSWENIEENFLFL